MDLEKKVERSSPGFFKRIMRKALPYVLVVAGGITAAGIIAGCRITPEPEPDYTTEIAAITKAADRLVETQNNDGGWEWDNPDTNPATGIPSPKNTVGVTAQGVLDAYRVNEKEAYLDTAKDAFGYMEDLSSGDWRIRGPDLTFLVELSEETGNLAYADFAKTRWGAAKTEFADGTATGFAQYIRDTRKPNYPALISWDIDLYLQGALALNRHFPGQGFGTEAQEMAEVIYDSLYVDGDFDFSDTNQDEYWAAFDGAIRAFATTGLHTAERNSLITDLLSSQESDGHFVGVGDGSDVQTTAYAIMSLLKANRRAPTDGAVDYLTGSQLSNGGWEYGASIENTEVTSEAAQAISDYIN